MAYTNRIHKSSIAVKQKKQGMWEKAILYLESELEQARNPKRIAQIKAAIHTFRANLDRGVPWPTESATHH